MRECVEVSHGRLLARTPSTPAVGTGAMSVAISSTSQVMALRRREARGLPRSFSYTAIVPGRGPPEQTPREGSA